jgi:uncharacterized membrane protein YcaP (DUF421 family)
MMANFLWSDVVPNLFYSGMPSIAEKMLRPLLVYVFLLVGLRLAGKRELAQLNPFDLVVLLTLSNTVQNAIIGNDSTVTGGVLGATTLLVINYLVVRVLHSHPHLERIVAGRRDYLIRDGKILRDHLQREIISRPELLAAAHKQGISSLDDIQTAILESTGVITFVAKSPTEQDTRYQQILDRMETLVKEIVALRQGADGKLPQA